jgi:hypothetical protein
LPADVNQELLGLGLFNGDVLDEQPQHSLAVLGMGGASMPYTLNAIYEQDFLDCKCAGAERPRGPSAFRRGTCDRGIWMKPLAFVADAGELILYLWVFNGRFAIGSPPECQKPRSSRNVGTAQRSLLSLKTQIL